MGDGALIYFGYPQAHEDDAERATRCGLALVDRVPQLKQAEELHARVGIAAGLVVVGGEVVERDVAGDTPNLAARLQALAEPDTVVIAVSTRRLTGELFEYRDLGKIELKGIAGPVSAWQALRPSAVASRFEALRGSALTPLVGRDEEIELLLRRWARVKAGDNQVVLISGEPGIGKSRIVASLVERLRDEPHLRLRYFCSPYHQNSALYPFIDQLGRAAGLDDQWGKFGPGCERQLTLPPSEYFKRQCYLALDADEEPAVDVVEKLGADYFVVSTDYPHPDGAFPEAMKEFLALSLDNAARRKILWDNCARLYDIPKLAAPLTRAAPAAAAAA